MGDPAAPRWRGQRGRLEVWYASATDRATGDGVWIHHERVAPTEGDPYCHGWIARYPAGGAPSVARFGPDPAGPPDRGGGWLQDKNVSTGPERLTGTAGTFTWDLKWTGEEPPMWTLPQAMWERELLPSAHVVVAPRATFRGTITESGHATDFDGIGNIAHIYGHGNAQRWSWLHADLDDDTTLEVIVAVSRRPGMRRIPPLPFVQLRRRGQPDWPRNSLLTAPLFRARLASPTWRVRGMVGSQRLTVTVSQPDERCVRLDYTDPDGAHAVCTNTEIADVDVVLAAFHGRWRVEQEWSLRGTAHAELGTRAQPNQHT
jgi:hypothetical protein